jgi:hypothetical protein
MQLTFIAPLLLMEHLLSQVFHLPVMLWLLQVVAVVEQLVLLAAVAVLVLVVLDI